MKKLSDISTPIVTGLSPKTTAKPTGTPQPADGSGSATTTAVALSLVAMEPALASDEALEASLRKLLGPLERLYDANGLVGYLAVNPVSRENLGAAKQIIVAANKPANDGGQALFHTSDRALVEHLVFQLKRDLGIPLGV